jgi:hypothetical protein
MILPAVFFTLALVPPGPGDAAEPWREHEAACHRLADAAVTPRGVSADGLAAAGDACRTASEAAPALASRAVLVLEAASYYQRAHGVGHAEALCTSATMLRTLGARLAAEGPGTLPNDQAAISTRLAAIEPTIAGRCKEDDVKKEDPPPTVAATPTPEGPSPGPRDARPGPMRAPALPSPARCPLRIAGGAVLGVGLALGGGMVAALVRGASLQDQAEALSGQHREQTIDSDDASMFAAITRRGELADHTAIGLGVAAGALSVVGAALLVLDARRNKTARFALQPSILPTAGIRLALEF